MHPAVIAVNNRSFDVRSLWESWQIAHKCSPTFQVMAYEVEA